ncbi:MULTISPECIES: transglycosylase domain-containing protein [unclassified Mucilaginibacter]|uniref:penicillin-binding protein 1A n=1 Tax=unclassified Mucilaginibacter TaxID=2617802 RepID=UPI002AC972C7|nr:MULTISPECIES: transglycosylase domain-containing protein [unclassified Mucilaginibacter]MEB0261234.1 transglycosylase domain-containing protein [Mucilaginibacter sp. 10I4]MEB0279058.1 transglycosylase domain-containing protein [Mucilaginibacter sp. 10B2]MEB0299923.1 transglycosylase domain-containing protein [Mucilaginibacter sp. 5C4]WPX22236.1 transglycosylase domain-containing protein [Mucilaginibacter sp. 5C4]
MFREIKNRYLRYFTIFIYAIIVFFCAIEINFLWLFGYSPDMQDIKQPTMSVSSEVYTADGKLIGRFYKENRSPVEYKAISLNLIHALVATEDVRFYKHGGVDFLGFMGSLVSTATGERRGGSTITQQLAKNLFSTRKRKSQGLIKHIPLLRTVVFKCKEWITAYKIEHQYSKEQILTMYLNTVPFGNNSFGIKTATLKYFNKMPDAVNPAEAATLIGMLKATSTYNPKTNPTRSVERRNVVLSQMLKYNYIDKPAYAANVALPLNLDLSYVDRTGQGDSYIRRAVEKWLDKWCKQNDYDLYEDGLKIYTTIDSKLQQYAEEAVATKMKMLQKRFNNLWGNKNPWRDSKGVEIKDFLLKAEQRLPIYKLLSKKHKGDTTQINNYFEKKKRMSVFTWNGDKDTTFSSVDSIKYYTKILNTGMMTMEPSTGKIKVWVGGIDHKYFNYDHVNQAKRQAGSTFKPFAYVTALDNGFTPCDKFTDKPVTIKFKDNGKDDVWQPNNADFHFSYREMSLRWAMGKSVNSITAQVTEHVGWDKIVEYAHKIGIESPLKSVPSVSLGSNDVSVYEMVRAYSTFLNKGEKVDPLLVTKITDQKGNVIEEFTLKAERVLSEETAWLMLYMFRGGMEEPGGTSQALWEYPSLWKKNNQIGGKTGTSSDYVDGWYMGITKDLVTGIWVGADDRSVHFTNSETGEGSHTALPIFGAFMEKVYADPNSGYTYGPFPKPWVKITKEYMCPSPQIREDTTSTDSLMEMPMDTTAAPVSVPATEEKKEEMPENKPPATK